MQIKLNDNTVLESTNAVGRKGHYQNASREMLEFEFNPKNISLEQLERLFEDESKTKKIHIIEEDSTYIHKHYTILAGLALKKIEVSQETVDSPAIYEDRLVVTLAQLTYNEVKIAQQEEDIAFLYYFTMMGSDS